MLATVSYSIFCVFLLFSIVKYSNSLLLLYFQQAISHSEDALLQSPVFGTVAVLFVLFVVSATVEPVLYCCMYSLKLFCVFFVLCVSCFFFCSLLYPLLRPTLFSYFFIFPFSCVLCVLIFLCAWVHLCFSFVVFVFGFVFLCILFHPQGIF